MIRVLSIGCYDLLHYGHIVHLLTAKELGGTLIVGLTEDDVVLHEKGYGHPLFPWIERHSMLASIRYVDEIIPHRDFYRTIKEAHPKILVKGMDWQGKMPKQEAYLKELGIEIAYLETYPVYSSTKIMTGKMLNERTHSDRRMFT